MVNIWVLYGWWWLIMGIYGGFLSHGDTPQNHHPCIDGLSWIFHYKATSALGDPPSMETSIFNHQERQNIANLRYPPTLQLLGGWFTPLKNMSSSIGMMTLTQYFWENKIHGNQTTNQIANLRYPPTLQIVTWWFIPRIVSGWVHPSYKWSLPPLIPFISRVITHLRSVGWTTK